MRKPKRRATGLISVMLFALVAGSPARSQEPAKAQPTPPVSIKATQSGKEYQSYRFGVVFTTTIKHVVGSCNTTQGCKVLKNVCETLPKHTFATNEEESVGVCADTTRNSGTGAWFLRNTNTAGNTSNDGGNNEVTHKRPESSEAQGNRRYAVITILKRVDRSSPALNCEGAAICRKVQSTCATLGGTYKRISDDSGACKH